MFQLRRFLRGRIAGHVAIAVLAFSLGGSTVVFAANSGALKLQAFNLADGTDPSQLAKVDASGNVAVSVANTPTVSITGTPSVSIAGSTTVKLNREPFQVFVTAVSSGAEACEAIVVPAGKQLTIESFSADATSITPPSVYLRETAVRGPTTSFVRSLSLKLVSPASNQWAGDVQTLLIFGGGADANGSTITALDACVSTPSGYFRGFVTGYLEPLQ